MASTNSTILKLSFEKGPRNGETLEFSPRSTVRLGRVVRGNTLPVKDPGISSKHLTIDFHSGSGEWVVTDLDSSNGTILNSSQLQPFSPNVINDGDVIKIGEITLIRVSIGEIGDGGGLRRNPRRGAGKIGGELGVGKNCSNLGEEASVRVLDGNDVGLKEDKKRQGRGRGRGRQKNADVLEGDEHVEGSNFVEEVRVRVLDENDGVKEVEVELEKDNLKGRGRGRGRGRTKKVGVLEGDEHVEGSNLGEVRVLDGNDEVKGVELEKDYNKAWGRGRGRSKKVVVLDGDEHVEGSNLREEVRVRVLEGNEDGDSFRDRVRVRILDENDLVEGVELENDDKKGRGRGRGRGQGRSKKAVVLEEKNDERKGSDEVIEENVKVKMEGGVSTRRTTSSRKEVEELMSLDVLKSTRSTRSTKNVDDVALRKVKQENELDVGECRKAENVGAVEIEKTKGGRGFRGGRKVNVKVELDGDEDVGLGDESGRNLPGIEGSEIVELREKSCEGDIGDGALRNMIQDEVSCDVSIMGSLEHPCARPIEETVHKDENFLDKEIPEQVACSLVERSLCDVEISSAQSSKETLQKDENFLETEVPEQVECSLVGGSLGDIEHSCAQTIEETVQKDENFLDMEVHKQVQRSLYAVDQPCVWPINDTTRHDESEENLNKDVLEVEADVQHEGSLSICQQPCPEPVNKTGQQKELNEEVENTVSELEVPEIGDVFQCTIENSSLEPIDESLSQYEGTVGPSHVEEESSHGLGCDFVMEDKLIRACDPEKIPEESDTGYQGKEKGRESLQVPNLEKMTLGEWFDYLEAYFPNQIYTATDEVIEEMRKRAKQFDEFMSKQQNEKGQLPIAVEGPRHAPLNRPFSRMM